MENEKWDIKKFKASMFADPENNRIVMETQNAIGMAVKRLIELDDELTRACLIQLGWTPPKQEGGAVLLDRRRLDACLEYCKGKSTGELEALNYARMMVGRECVKHDRCGDECMGPDCPHYGEAGK